MKRESIALVEGGISISRYPCDHVEAGPAFFDTGMPEEIKWEAQRRHQRGAGSRFWSSAEMFYRSLNYV